MKAWNFKVKSNPKEISEKLESALGSVNGFVFNINTNNNGSAIFKIRKLVHYPSQIFHVNRIIVNGKILKTEVQDETNVEVSFSQHYLIKLILITHLVLGLAALIAIFSGINSSPSMYILLVILIAIGIALWIAVQNKFEKDIQKYKTLISGILES